MNARITKLVSRFPWATSPLLIGAPMRVLSGPHLAVAISAAGGLGFIGPGAKTDDLKPDLETAKELVRNADSLRSASLLPVGVGFQLWNDTLETAAELIKQYRPCAVWLYAPKDDAEFETWSAKIRKASDGTSIWIQVGTLGEVKRLLDQSQHPDVIVVQGAEAGGHGRAEDGLGAFTLVPEVVELLHERGVDIPVVAAGGIVDGRGAAASLCLGADGVAMGTRFLASSEARIGKGYQDEIVRASDGGLNTTRTLLYNHLRGTFGWPKEYAPRTIINQSHHDQKAGTPFETLKERHDEAVKAGRGWGPDGRTATYASASIGLIKDVLPAKEIVKQTHKQMRSLLADLRQPLASKL
ncbi:Nitronate monooxygenase [Cyphellophora attinorum]|uniref:Nitronate monooxygenase n=1 Tax=Cyphellophora attinorum TaxID=1664694 RepID=A0A0N0NHK0_9EURO|nr:Nitronate monooxygenase [Phialophora attinorum]KPI34359.1 Nitronate monooxygenase [Phialophora attinorum]